MNRLREMEIRLGEMLEWMIELLILLGERKEIKYWFVLYPEAIVVERGSKIIVSEDLLN